MNFYIDTSDRAPIYEQIVNSVIKMCRTGALSEGDALPSVRSLAAQLAINPNTIQKAYSVLESKGVIVSIAGKGSVVSENAAFSRELDDEIASGLFKAACRARALGLSRERALEIISSVYTEKTKEE